MDAVKIDDVLRLQDFGLERLDEDRAILGFAQRAEARIARWLDFAKGALLMLMVPNDPESGCFYIYDRGREAFYALGLPVEGRFGGFREDEFDGLCQTFGLKALAQNPQAVAVLKAAPVFGGTRLIPYIDDRSATVDHQRPATAEMAAQFHQIFVNRRAYTLQSFKPHPDTGRHYYFRPKAREGQPAPGLSLETLRQHLAGDMTVGLYSINPKTQRSKWVAIDADYKNAIEDLLKLQYELTQDGVEPALEKSNRGGHLWIFFEQPALAKDCRVYIYHTALRLGLPIKGAGLPDGIEIFPRQDEIGPGEFGNAIRAPLGVHRGAKESRGWRFWFYNADYTLTDQLEYLGRLRKVTEGELHRFVAGKEIPAEFARRARQIEGPLRYYATAPGEFRILDYVEVRRQAGRNWIARCPSCANSNHDRSGDNLAISVDEPRKYICWAGCSKGMIREALGRPISQTRYA